MDIKYSVIVPVYNAEKYLEECLNSLANQSFEACEYIIWNDGSTDRSEDIIKKYSKDKRFRIYEDKNRGVSIAREKALERAKGKYVLFLDSDDIMADTALSKIDSIMDDTIDLLQFSSTENFYQLNQELDFTVQIYNRENFLDNYVRKILIDGNEGVVLWDKVFKREILVTCLKEYPFNMLEDYVYILRYAEQVHKFCKVSAVFHFYRYIDNSLSRCFNNQWFKILVYVQKLKQNYMQKLGVNESMDQIHAAEWFIRYTKNFLLNNGRKMKAVEIKSVLADNILLEKCILVENSKFDNRFSVSIRGKKFKNIIIKIYTISLAKVFFRRVRSIVLSKKGWLA